MSLIHPTASIHSNAKLGERTRVGAYCIVGEHAVIGKDCNIQEHVVIRGHTELGDEVQVYPFAVLGASPQHLRYKGEPTRVVIGNRVIVREYVTVHRGTSFGRGATQIGDDSYLMAYTHVAHDCVVGRNVILANAIQLGGHVEIQDFVTIGGQSGVAQFCRVGRYCYIGGGTIIRKDLPPFLLGKGNDFEVQGINTIGLERHGFSSPTIKRLRALYKIFYLQHLTVEQALERVVAELGESDEVHVFVQFVRESKVGIVR